MVYLWYFTPRLLICNCWLDNTVRVLRNGCCLPGRGLIFVDGIYAKFGSQPAISPLTTRHSPHGKSGRARAREIEEKINNSDDDERWEARSIRTVINAGGDRDSEGGTKRNTTDARCPLKRRIAADCAAMHRAVVEAAPPTGSALCH